MDRLRTDICVIGAGAAGLSVAAAAAMLGRETVVVEPGPMGGDCLNFGCVPSKSIIAAARHAHVLRMGASFGIDAAAPHVDFERVRAHIRDVIATIAPIDSQERFEGLGATVLRAPASFQGPSELIVGERIVTARRFVIATGSRPFVPSIPGLSEVPYLTNETVFDLTVAPSHLMIIGAGPIGIEMAQAHRRLGAAVTVVEAGRALGRDDPELIDLLLRRLRDEGVDVRLATAVQSVARSGDEIAVTLAEAGGQSVVRGSHLLVAAGRTPVTDGLNLAAAGVAYTDRGITVDRRLRTTNRRIYALGDAVGGLQFTHVAGYQASIVVSNVLFRLPARVSYTAAPWVTFTDPELAHVGLNEAEARARFGDRLRVLRLPLAENDRAQAERRTEGLFKVVVSAKGRVLGATILAPDAGNLIQPWILAVGGKLKLKDIATMIAPYPTLGEASKRVAGQFYQGKVFGPAARALVGLLAKLG